MKNWKSETANILECLYAADPEDEHPVNRDAIRIVKRMSARLERAEREAAALRSSRKLLSYLENWMMRNMDFDGFEMPMVHRVRKAIGKIDAAKGGAE